MLSVKTVTDKEEQQLKNLTGTILRCYTEQSSVIATEPRVQNQRQAPGEQRELELKEEEEKAKVSKTSHSDRGVHTRKREAD